MLDDVRCHYVIGLLFCGVVGVVMTRVYCRRSSVQPSVVYPLTSILCDAISLYLVEGFQ